MNALWFLAFTIALLVVLTVADWFAGAVVRWLRGR